MKSEVGGLALAPVQKEALVAFLHTLTDTVFVNNPKFQDPTEGVALQALGRI